MKSIGLMAAATKAQAVAYPGSFVGSESGSHRNPNASFASQASTAIRELKTSANSSTYVAIVVAMLGAMMFGIDQTNFGLASEFPDFYEYWCQHCFPEIWKNTLSFHPDLHKGVCVPAGTVNVASEWKNFQSWGGSLITLGACAGCVALGPFLANGCGRRPCISAGGVICFLGCLIVCYINFKSTGVYYVGRFLTGFGVGTVCYALPMYNAEIATPGIRGLMGSLFQFMVMFGGVITAVILAFQKNTKVINWEFGYIMPGVCGIIVAIGIWFVPESPSYIMGKHGFDAGHACLLKVRSADAAATLAEAKMIQRELEEDKKK